MKSLNLNKREKSLFIIAVTVILAGFIYFRIINVYRNSWVRQSLQIKENQQIVQKEKNLIAQTQELNIKFETLVKKIQAQLPQNREEGQFLNEIQKVAEDTYVHIAAINPLPVKEIGSFRELSVEIELEANLGNLVRFLYYMRKSSVVLVAQRLRLEPKSERSALLKVNLVISTIFLNK
ncbi:MAG: type 4a pilus biogenesis protein PilO [Candidatus Omnitrophica bacterium]|nr:type 4a pilus biogenesis protein PilO [Candidatus Omnitrophota bacterium]